MAGLTATVDCLKGDVAVLKGDVAGLTAGMDWPVGLPFLRSVRAASRFIAPVSDDDDGGPPPPDVSSIREYRQGSTRRD